MILFISMHSYIDDNSSFFYIIFCNKFCFTDRYNQYNPVAILELSNIAGELPAGTQLKLTRDSYGGGGNYSHLATASSQALATLGSGSKPLVPDSHHVQFMDAGGGVLGSYQIDSGTTDYRGYSWTRSFYVPTYLRNSQDGSNYQVRIFIKTLIDGQEKIAYSRIYPLTIVTINSAPGGG